MIGAQRTANMQTTARGWKVFDARTPLSAYVAVRALVRALRAER
jgi:hypothetical protein